MLALMMMEQDPLLLVVTKDNILSGGFLLETSASVVESGTKLLHCCRFSS